MLRKLFTPALAAMLFLSACELSSTGPSAATLGEDYALAMFGETGTALEGTMGPHSGPRPFDGRTGRRRVLQLRDELIQRFALSEGKDVDQPYRKHGVYPV